jgi:hypothetical protein
VVVVSTVEAVVNDSVAIVDKLVVADSTCEVGVFVEVVVIAALVVVVVFSAAICDV